VADGPTALTFVRGDAALAAKVLDSFSRQANILEVKGGVMGDRALTPDEIRRLARLPARDVLIGQFAGIVASPFTGLARGLGALLSGLAVALGQIHAQKEAGGPSEPEPPAAEEAPAEEAAAEEGAPGAEEEAPAAEAEQAAEAQAEQPAPESDSSPDSEAAAEEEAQ
jgi:large subunit ribosomal protein L10